VANPDGSNAYTVTGDIPFQGPSAFYGASPDWCPDGKWIVYQNPGGQLVIVPSAGFGAKVTVTSITGDALSPAWSR
jgi:Tol biopolymer transport system component